MSTRTAKTQPEVERLRKQVLLRLSPEELGELDRVASQLDMCRSAAVAHLARTWAKAPKTLAARKA